MVVGNSGARGGVSSPLWGTAFRCALNALVLLLECALSGTLAFLRHYNCHLAQDKTTVAVRDGCPVGSVCGNATHGSTSRRSIGDPDEVRVAFGLSLIHI